MTGRVRRLSAALAIVAGASALSGCSPAVLDVPGDFSGGVSCYAPLACGPMYPVAYYPYYAHPYIGYLHDPAHTVILTTGGRTTVVYRPYSAPLRPTPPRTTTTLQKPPAPAAKPAPAKAPAPAPKPATRK